MASVATVVLSLLVAQRVDATSFGIFAVVIATWIIVTGSIRAGTGELLIFHHSHRESDEFSSMSVGAQSSAFVGSIFVGVLLAVIGFLVPNITVPFLLLALGLPALVAQDNNRYILSARGTPGIALGLDFTFVALLIVLSNWVFAPQSLDGLLICWITASWISALLGLAFTKIGFNLRRGQDWLRSQKAELGMFVGDFAIANGVANSAVFIVAILGTVADAGAIRGSQILLVPILLVMRGASVAFGPQLTRHANSGNSAMVLKICFGLTLAQFLAVAISALLLYMAPDSLLSKILGDSAQSTMKLFPYAALATLALGSATVVMLGLKSGGHVRSSMILKMWMAPGTIGLMFWGVVIGGAVGSQLALAMGELVRTVLQWRVLSRWNRTTTSTRDSSVRGNSNIASIQPKKTQK